MHTSKPQSRNPSFSSTLLDEIYNSIDHKTPKTQSITNTTKKQSIATKPKIHQERFFSSVSTSSDSSSSIFSSSDTELTHHGNKKTSSHSSRPLCFGPSKTKVTKPSHQNRTIRISKDYDYTSDVPKSTRYDEERRRKPKTPASPGGRIVNFINSLFTHNNAKHSNPVKSKPRKMSYDDSVYVRKVNDYYNPSTCSSATSFSRSCLNKNSEKSSDRIKRSVRFSPVNVIVPEIKSFVEEEEYFSNVRKSVKKNVEVGGRRSVEEIARDFLRDYHQKSNGRVKNDFEDYGNDDDDVASDSSSDLFELDLVGNHHCNNNMYGDELPVYETTFAGFL